MHIDRSFAAGNQVVIAFTETSVFTEDYFGVPANRATVPLKEVHVYTLREGWIVENLAGAINLPFEFTMYEALKGAVLDSLEVTPN